MATVLIFKTALLGAGLAIFGGSVTGFASVVTVGVGNGNSTSFTPTNNTILVGDSVAWVWNNSNTTKHSTTSDTPGLWDSGTNAPPFSFTNKFNAVGTFPYHCTIHLNPPFNMRATIIVQAPNSPPTVSITNPTPGAVFAAPAIVTIQATASDSDGTVTSVQFLVGSTVLTNETAAPFSAITNLAAGNYTLSAVATDNSGAQTTNAAAINIVTPGPVVLSAPQSTPVNFQFSYTANAGLRYVIQSSTNLLSSNWIPLITNMAGANSVTFTDVNATANPGFYRVGLLPNP